MPVKKVMRIAALLHLLTTACLFGLPLILVAGIATGQFGANAIVAAQGGLPPGTSPGSAAIVLFLLIEAALLAVFGYVLWQVRALFGQYATGDILTADSAHHITRAAVGLLILALSGMVAQAAQALALTWGNAPGSRQLSIALSDDEICAALAGGLLWVIGWAMGEAARMAAENREFI